MNLILKFFSTENDCVHQGAEPNDPEREANVAEEHLLQEDHSSGHRERLHRRRRRQRGQQVNSEVYKVKHLGNRKEVLKLSKRG